MRDLAACVLPAALLAAATGVALCATHLASSEASTAAAISTLAAGSSVAADLSRWLQRLAAAVWALGSLLLAALAAQAVCRWVLHHSRRRAGCLRAVAGVEAALSGLLWLAALGFVALVAAFASWLALAFVSACMHVHAPAAVGDVQAASAGASTTAGPAVRD